MITFKNFFLIYEAFEQLKTQLKAKEPGRESEINYLFNKYEKFRDARQLRLQDEDIQQIVKKGVEYFVNVMKDYPEEPVTKPYMMTKVVAKNKEWVVFKIDNALEAYRIAHGLGHWCIVADHKDPESADNQYWFDIYTHNGEYSMYIARRKDDYRRYDNLDCICIIRTSDGSQTMVKDANDECVNFSQIPNFVNVNDIGIK